METATDRPSLMDSEKKLRLADSEFNLHAAALRFGTSIIKPDGWPPEDKAQAENELKAAAAAYRWVASEWSAA